MTRWIATGYGALELNGEAGFVEGTELVVTPTVPQMPVALTGEPAALWRQLLNGVEEQTLTADERSLLLEFGEHGIAGVAPHAHAIDSLDRPWLVSPLHELLYAIVAKVAADAGIDLVFIKGPMQHRQGLRDREHSGDIDVWVRPADQQRLTAAMYPWGWRPVHGLLAGTSVESHSQTLWPSAWGSSIDVHTRYPGMNLDPELAFEALLAEAETWSFAGTKALVPSRPVSALLRALHDVRPYNSGVDERLAHEAAGTLAKCGEDMVDVASRFNAVGVLQDAFRLAFPAISLAGKDLSIPEEWHRLATANSFERLRLSMRGMPPGTRLRVLSRLIWPDADTMFGISESRNYQAKSRLHARLYWIRDGLREVLPTSKRKRRP